MNQDQQRAAAGPVEDQSWRDHAACLGQPAEVFFPDGRQDTLDTARELCRSCPVSTACLEEALRVRDIDGFRAGMTGRERQKLLAKSPARSRTPTDEILRLKHRLRWSAQAISVALEVHPDVVRHVAGGRRPKQTPRVTPETVEVAGVVRRRQALACIGYGLRELAVELGVSESTVSSHTARRVVLVETRDRWRELYARLAGAPGPNGKARKAALKAGWLPPAAWTEDTIDDPDALPWPVGEVAA